MLFTLFFGKLPDCPGYRSGYYMDGPGGSRDTGTIKQFICSAVRVLCSSLSLLLDFTLSDNSFSILRKEGRFKSKYEDFL